MYWIAKVLQQTQAFHKLTIYVDTLVRILFSMMPDIPAKCIVGYKIVHKDTQNKGIQWRKQIIYELLED